MRRGRVGEVEKRGKGGNGNGNGKGPRLSKRAEERRARRELKELEGDDD